jgi:chromosome segregation ATPase
MKFFLCLTAALAATAAAQSVTPVEKVIELMKDLKSQVETEGTEEAGNYDTFACFCKKKMEGLASTITQTKQEIDILSADIEANTKDKVVTAEELEERKKDHEKLKADLASTEERLSKEQAEYDADAADLQKAIDSLRGAITSLEDAKPAAALIALRRVVKKGSMVEASLNSLKSPSAGAVKAFLQNGATVDPSDPEYKYHSQGILDTLSDLEETFTAKKTTLDSDWTKAKTAMEDEIKGYNNAIDANDKAMKDLEKKLETLALTIASDREALVMDDAMLKDDKVYLSDLSDRCKARAEDWDQRSQMRAGELKAITAALDILENEVAPREGKRTKVKEESYEFKAPFLVQVSSHKQQNAHDLALWQQQAQSKVLAMLTQESQRLKSKDLSMLTMKLTDDPFAKVKVLIQQLIERLIQESIDEATKEGYCNKELAEAEKDRDYRFKDVMKLNTEIKGLELKKDELDAEIEELETALEQLHEDLKTAKEDREKEHALNMEEISTAKKGLEAVTQAIIIIKTFYMQSGKAIALVQASPVDEDTTGPGFEGNYGGKQQASQGIIGMLEVIKTDFERTVSKTTESEEKAQQEFVEFDRATKTDISGKETKLELDKEDLKTTVATLGEKMTALENQQGLLDAALKQLVALKPMCTDFGQSYADRVAKRKEEIKALENAVCMLAPEDLLERQKVEPQCQFGR